MSMVGRRVKRSLTRMQKYRGTTIGRKYMNAQVKFWIPKGIPEEDQIVLSIPGSQPKTVNRHLERLQEHLLDLGRKLEEEQGKAELFRAVRPIAILDENLAAMEGQGHKMVVGALLASDQFPLMSKVLYLKAGVGHQDRSMQETCRMTDLEQRIQVIAEL
jgi:hypothetical protein